MSSLEAAILDFLLPVSSGSYTSNSIEIADYENTGVAIDIWSLSSCVAAEILLLGLSLSPFVTHVCKLGITTQLKVSTQMRQSRLNDKHVRLTPPFISYYGVWSTTDRYRI